MKRMKKKVDEAVLRYALQLRVKPQVLLSVMHRRKVSAQKAFLIVERTFNKEREKTWEF